MYVLQLFDAFAASGTVLLIVVICECLVVGWLYGERQTVTVNCAAGVTRWILLMCRKVSVVGSSQWSISSVRLSCHFLATFENKITKLHYGNRRTLMNLSQPPNMDCRLTMLT